MNIQVIEKIADAVLYEGYMLYPYRASAVKNQQRFNFGVLYPREYCEFEPGSEAFEMRTECLVEGSGATAIEAKVRFLQMATRQDWQEGLERDVCLFSRTLDSLIASPSCERFLYGRVLDEAGRKSETIVGQIELHASQIQEGLFKLSLIIRNETRLEAASDLNRDRLLLRSFVSTHSILHAVDGGFVSLFDPPERYEPAVTACRSVGAWPVLAGDPGQRDLILAAPIILYDYPQVAPESGGDLFDGTEIDEILALRILTLTEAEKEEIRNGDDRARMILERTERMPLDQFRKLHGALRGLSASGRSSR